MPAICYFRYYYVRLSLLLNPHEYVLPLHFHYFTITTCHFHYCWLIIIIIIVDIVTYYYIILVYFFIIIISIVIVIIAMPHIYIAISLHGIILVFNYFIFTLLPVFIFPNKPARYITPFPYCPISYYYYYFACFHAMPLYIHYYYMLLLFFRHYTYYRHFYAIITHDYSHTLPCHIDRFTLYYAIAIIDCHYC